MPRSTSLDRLPVVRLLRLRCVGRLLADGQPGRDPRWRQRSFRSDNEPSMIDDIQLIVCEEGSEPCAGDEISLRVRQWACGAAADAVFLKRRFGQTHEVFGIGFDAAGIPIVQYYFTR